MNLNTTKTCRAEGLVGFSYSTPIVVVLLVNKQIRVTTEKYSVTTSKHSGQLVRHYAQMFPDFEIVRVPSISEALNEI